MGPNWDVEARPPFFSPHQETTFKIQRCPFLAQIGRKGLVRLAENSGRGQRSSDPSVWFVRATSAFSGGCVKTRPF